jgi:hypothetical protein
LFWSMLVLSACVRSLGGVKRDERFPPSRLSNFQNLLRESFKPIIGKWLKKE